MKIHEIILNILRREVAPSVGCTEPVAIALNGAYAASILQGLGEQINSIELNLSKGIYKNGMDVGIPGTEKTGLDVATTLGIALADPSNGLELLGSIGENERKLSDYMLEYIPPMITPLKESKPIFIETIIKTDNHIICAITEDKHDNITSLQLDGIDLPVEKKDLLTKNSTADLTEFYNLSIDEIVKAIEDIPAVDLEFLLDGLKVNLGVANMGTVNPYGLAVGYNSHLNMEEGLVSRDLVNLAFTLTAAASDVRMSGERIPVMSSSGSGNNGLTAILPIAAFHELQPVDDEKLSRALAISHIITGYVKVYIGRLSNICTCSIAASIGSGSAIAWILGGRSIIGDTINNIIANQAGVICDGAKPGCALKLGTAASTAIQSALLAYRGTRLIEPNGLADTIPENSIRNLAALSSKGMTNVDNTIIDIMEKRHINPSTIC
ncbi:MAG: serine dehydratase subunit alpha family protein [Tissierellia bacterium]|nr:serine dehydratase subunit alpha family protein [Tissierellia bacterium]